ncbi:ppr repeat-containing protein [Cystoisospora suis]|uniref:Ppr repeat-containing protein n=1 Tax=Cystoisospora suis TaxID=483139 RepID=A0A2C6L8A3_9APIC|nr:ppr repeat-containing protein [Cystoisospora suis]
MSLCTFSARGIQVVLFCSHLQTPVSISSFLRDALRPPDPGMKALLRRLFISFSRLEAVYSLLREQTAGFSARTQAESEQPSLQRSRERQTGTASLLGSAHFGASDETAACVGRQDAGREDGLHTTCPHSDKAQNTLSRPAVEAAFRALSTIRSVAMKLTGDFRGSSPRGLDNALHSASQSHLMRVAVQSAVTRARAVGHFLDVFLALRRRRGAAVLGADSRTSGNRLRRAVPEGTTVNGSRVFGVPSLDEASNGTSLDLRQPTRQGNTASVSSAVPPQTMSTSFDRGPCVPANKSGFASRPFVEKCWLCSLLPSERRLLRAAIENIERLADGSVHHCLENSDQLLQARGLSDKTLFGSLSSIPEMLSPGASRETDMRGGSGEGTEGFSLPSSSTSVCHHGGGGRSGDALSEGPRMTLWSSVQQETSDVPHSQSGESGQVLSAEGSPFVIAVESRKGGATQQSKATHVFSRDASQQPTELTKLTARPQCSDRIMEGKAGVQLLCQSASRAVSPDGLLRVEQRSESPSKVRSRGHVAEVRSTTANKLAPSSSLGKGRYNSFSIVNPTQGYQLRTVENGAREALGKLFRLAEATLLSSSVFSSPSHFPDERSDDNRQPVKSITRFERTVGHPALSGGASARLAEAFALFKALVQAGGGAEVPMPFPGKSAGRPVSVLESGGRTRDSQRKTEETEKWTEEESVFRRQREGAARVPGERSDQEEMRLWVVPDVAAFNALLNACAQAGHLALAHAVFTT